MSVGKLFVISGASGAGKSSVLEKVLKARPDLLFSISATTRPMREGERDGVNYFFVSVEAFKEMIAQDAFVEYDFHNDHYYGTLRSQIRGNIHKGNMVLDVEPNGAMNIRQMYPDATLIFITPPSIAELERRLRDRKDTDEEQIRLRLNRASWEETQKDRYDYVVVNDVLEQCAEEVLRIIAQKLD